MLTQVNLLVIQQHTAGSARNRNRSVLFSLTHGEGVVDTKAAKDSVHIAGVKESVPSNYHFKRFWDRGNTLCLMFNTCCVLNIFKKKKIVVQYNHSDRIACPNYYFKFLLHGLMSVYLLHKYLRAPRRGFLYRISSGSEARKDKCMVECFKQVIATS